MGEFLCSSDKMMNIERLNHCVWCDLIAKFWMCSNLYYSPRILFDYTRKAAKSRAAHINAVVKTSLFCMSTFCTKFADAVQQLDAHIFFNL